LLTLLGTAVLILSVTLVASSALELRPPIPAATSSWPFVAILATVINTVVYLVWKVSQWQAATRRGLDLSDADLAVANLTNANPLRVRNVCVAGGAEPHADAG
jgi:hypothetical protein